MEKNGMLLIKPITCVPQDLITFTIICCYCCCFSFCIYAKDVKLVSIKNFKRV